MKKAFILKVSLMVLFTGIGSLAQAEFFVGQGWCTIESLPCKDGQSVSCSAQGSNGGVCVAEKKGGYYHLYCRANGSYGVGSSRVSRSCEYKRSLFNW